MNTDGGVDYSMNGQLYPLSLLRILMAVLFITGVMMLRILMAIADANDTDDDGCHR